MLRIQDLSIVSLFVWFPFKEYIWIIFFFCNLWNIVRFSDLLLHLIRKKDPILVVCIRGNQDS